jgi:phage shock protein PspC (stress-responsive transcriptional regulator)
MLADMNTTSASAARPALRRDADHKLLLGVCAGLARVLDTDPWIIRAAAIVVGIFTGPLAIVAYVATAAIVPRDDGRMLLGGDPPDKRENVLGWVGIVVACSMLLAAAPSFDVFWVDDGLRVPIVIVAVIAGVIVLARANRDRTVQDRMRAATAGSSTVEREAPAAPAATAEPAAAPETVEGDAVTTETVLAPTATAVVPARRVFPSRRPEAPVGPGGPMGPDGPDEPPTEVQPPSEPRPPRAPRGRSIFFPVAGALLAVAGGVVVLTTLGAFDMTAKVAAIALGAGAVGAGVTAAVAAGRRGTGAVLTVGILLALGAAGVAAADDQLDDGVGQRVYRPATAGDVRPEYRLGVGHLELDLRDTQLPVGTPTTVDADLGIGEILVRVAPDVRVVPVGDSDVGGDLDPVVVRRGDTAPVIRLDANTDIGAVRVER